jgi:hypothetical protein
MKRVILDYFRRRAWLFILGGLIQIALGFAQAFFAARGQENPVNIFQFQIGAFLGALILSFDLQRGLARTMVSLPLTYAQLGRAWWLATVALPGLGLGGLMALGVGIYHLFHPGRPMAWDVFAGNLLVLLLTLGVGFTLVFNMAQGARASTFWQRALHIGSGLLWGLSLGGGFLITKNISAHPGRLVFLLVFGVVLTVIGCVRAGAFARARASTIAGSQSGSSGPERSSSLSGVTGLPLFVIQNAGRGFLIGLAMLVVIPVIVKIQGQATWPAILRQSSGSSGSPFWLVLTFAMIPAIMQLRHLRTLPISSGRLAGVLISLLLLPVLALGVVSTTVCGLVAGETAAINAARTLLLSLPAAVLSVAIITWLGFRTRTYLLVGATMLISQIGTLIWLTPSRTVAAPLSLPQTALVVAAAVVLAFYLTRLALRRGTSAYRAPLGAFGQMWNLNR